MGFLPTPADGSSEAADALYEADRARLGYVAEYTRAFAARPDVFAAWAALNGAVKSGMSPRLYELATIGAARALGSTYCALAHGAVLLADGMEPGTLRAAVGDAPNDGLDATDHAVLTFAATVARDAGRVEQHDVDRLVALGLSEADVLAVVLAAAARCFFSTVLDATGTRADAPLAERFDAATLAALTVGRAPQQRVN